MSDQQMILILVIAFFLLGCNFSCNGMKEDFSVGVDSAATISNKCLANKDLLEECYDEAIDAIKEEGCTEAEICKLREELCPIYVYTGNGKGVTAEFCNKIRKQLNISETATDTATDTATETGTATETSTSEAETSTNSSSD